MFYSRLKSNSIKFEMTPLLDIIFILLIFFAVSTTLMTNHQGLKLDLPQAISSAKEEQGLIVSVSPNKEIFVNKQKVNINQLQTVIKQSIQENSNIKITLNADKNLAYHFIIEVLDQIRLGGGINIILQAEKKAD